MYDHRGSPNHVSPPPTSAYSVVAIIVVVRLTEIEYPIPVARATPLMR
jgi:hypothetical protein